MGLRNIVNPHKGLTGGRVINHQKPKALAHDDGSSPRFVLAPTHQPQSAHPYPGASVVPKFHSVAYMYANEERIRFKGQLQKMAHAIGADPGQLGKLELAALITRTIRAASTTEQEAHLVALAYDTCAKEKGGQ